MEHERNFGVSPLVEESLYHLEKYADMTVAEHTEIESVLDEITTRGLDLPANSRARSRIWHFQKDPWQFHRITGQPLLTLANLRFTIIEADDHDGGRRCNMLLRLDWTTHREKNNYGNGIEVPMLARVVNAAGDDIVHWDLGRLRMRPDWVRRPISFIQDFSPRTFDEIGGMNLVLFLFQGRLYEF